MAFLITLSRNFRDGINSIAIAACCPFLVMLFAFIGQPVHAQITAQNGQSVILLGDTPFEEWPGTRIWGEDASASMGISHMLDLFDINECAAKCVGSGWCEAFSFGGPPPLCRFFKNVSKGLYTDGYYAAIRTDNSLIAGREQIEEQKLTDLQRTALKIVLQRGIGQTATRTPDFDAITRQAIVAYQARIGAKTTGYLSRKQIGALVYAVGSSEVFQAVYDSLNRLPDNPWLAPQNCTGAVDALNGLTQRTAFVDDQLVRSGSTRAGEAFSLRATLPAAPDRFPAYLVIGFSQPVRVASDFGYVLQPKARFAFDLNVMPERTRLVIPLFTSDRPDQLRLAITPLRVGEMSVKAMLVAPSACGMVSASSLQFSTHVKPGAPRIVLSNPVGRGVADKVLINATQDRLAEIHKSSFRLVTLQGQVVLESEGTNVAFSPTGRFVAAFVNKEVTIWDVIDGARLGGGFSFSLGWQNEDSFAHVVSGGLGRTSVFSTGIDRVRMIDTEIGSACRSCIAHQFPTHFSLENDYFSGYGLSSGKDLTSRDGLADALRRHASILPVTEADAVIYEDLLTFTHNGGVLNQREIPPDYAGQFSARATAQIAMNDFVSKGAATGAGQPDGLDIPRALTRLNEEFGLTVLPSVHLRVLDKPVREPGSFDEPIEELMSVVDPTLSVTREESCYPDSVGRLNKHQTGLCAKSLTVWQARSQGVVHSLIGGGGHGGSAGIRYAIFGAHRSDRPGHINYHPGSVPFWGTEGNVCSLGCDTGVTLIGGSHIASFSDGATGFDVYNITTGQLRNFAAYRGNLTQSVHMLADRRHILQLNSDGIFAVHRLDAGAAMRSDEIGNPETVDTPQSPVLYGSYRDDEVIIWTDEFNFDASFEGAHLVNVNFAGTHDLHTFEQYAPLLRQAGLLEYVLQGKPARIAPPLVSPPKIEAVLTTASDGALSLTIGHAPGTLSDKVWIYQDGQLSGSVTTAGTPAFQLTVPRLPGARSVTVVPQDKIGMVGQPQTFPLTPDGTQSTIRAVLLGVNGFQDHRLTDLQAPAIDVFRFGQSLTSFAQENAQLTVGTLAEIGDASATPARILSELTAAVDAASANDTTLLFVSSHGVRDTDGELYIAVPGSDLSLLPETAVNWRDVSDIVASAKGRVMIFLDTCHSGQENSPYFATTDAIVGSALTQIASNVLIISAAKGREVAFEGVAGTVGSVFTDSVIDVLFEERDTYDRDESGLIEVSELYSGLKGLVLNRTNNRQTPWITRNRMIGDFPVF
ncbi:caspase family protein [Roseobacter sp. YSTF-M11]|uniref:Caspase family protein n=1 Tax=Roseobacter insulae TaxID=2859783 RepID=A0A9X1FY73_9RHOB|nr:caspase family protein [Roseobacter insulae]MBW4709210.1 caspase family protein [Roseobacter insulae]